MNKQDVIGKIFLFDGSCTYDKSYVYRKDIEFIAVEDLDKIKEIAEKKKKHIALVSEHMKFFIERS